jgi:hypothetical protein
LAARTLDLCTIDSILRPRDILQVRHLIQLAIRPVGAEIVGRLTEPPHLMCLSVSNRRSSYGGDGDCGGGMCSTVRFPESNKTIFL